VIFSLDKMLWQKYILRFVFFVAAAITFLPLTVSGNTESPGVQLPPGSSKVGRGRFRSPSNWADTIRFFDRQYTGYPRITIVNQPGLRAIHIPNRNKRSSWEGINIYELGSETRIFVLTREIEKKTDRSKKKI
jgi:hypothetical protein